MKNIFFSRLCLVLALTSGTPTYAADGFADVSGDQTYTVVSSVAAIGNISVESQRPSSIVRLKRISDKTGPLGKYGDTFQIVIVNGADQAVPFSMNSVTATVKGKPYPILTETRVAEIKEQERKNAMMWSGLMQGLAIVAASADAATSATGTVSDTNMALLQSTMSDSQVQSETLKERKSKETSALMDYYAKSALKDTTIEPFDSTGGFLAFEKLKAGQDVDIAVTVGPDIHRFSFRRK